MKCFRQASDYITVDSNVMSNVESWLLKQQSKVTVGMFNEPGRVIHTEMQVRLQYFILYVFYFISQF